MALCQPLPQFNVTNTAVAVRGLAGPVPTWRTHADTAPLKIAFVSYATTDTVA